MLVGHRTTALPEEPDMDRADLGFKDRVEVYTPTTGTYWGTVTAFTSDGVVLTNVLPEGAVLREAAAFGDIVRIVMRCR